MFRKIGVFISIIIFILGIALVIKWVYRQGEVFLEGNTLEDIPLVDLEQDKYVSFYIYQSTMPFGEEYSWGIKTCVSDGTEYEVYSVVADTSKDGKNRVYIQVLVKDDETKQKLKNLSLEKVFIQGEVIDTPIDLYDYNEEMQEDTENENEVESNFVYSDIVIKQTKLPDERWDLLKGIILIIFSIIVYCGLGGIKACVPIVVVEPKNYAMYKFEYSKEIHNIGNELMCEKDNLEKLQVEQKENNNVCNILIAMFFIGLIILLTIPVFGLKLVGLIPMFVGLGGIGSKFINSSHRLSVYIAHKTGKRSIYLEIEKCKKNIQELKSIMEEKNLS